MLNIKRQARRASQSAQRKQTNARKNKRRSGECEGSSGQTGNMQWPTTKHVITGHRVRVEGISKDIKRY